MFEIEAEQMSWILQDTLLDSSRGNHCKRIDLRPDVLGQTLSCGSRSGSQLDRGDDYAGQRARNRSIPPVCLTADYTIVPLKPSGSIT